MLEHRALLLEALFFLVAAALVAYRVKQGRPPVTIAARGAAGGGRVVVREYEGHRELALADATGGEVLIQGRVSLANTLVSGLPYTDGLHLGALATSRRERALFLGGGVMITPRQFIALYPELTVRVAELEPEVIVTARADFFLEAHPRLTVEARDGRAALEEAASASLDVIIVDAFGHDAAPRALASAPFFALCRERLRPGGCLVVNLAGTLAGTRGRPLRSIYAGVLAAFGGASVAAFGVPLEGEHPRPGTELRGARNTVVVARKGADLPEPEELAERAAALPLAVLPHLDAILKLRHDVDVEGLAPLTDPRPGRDDGIPVR